MKNILITAYFNLNVGDDLFVKILLERYKDHHFWIYTTKKNAIPFSKYKNITLIEDVIPSIYHRIINKFRTNNSHKKKYIRDIINVYTRKDVCFDGIVSIGGSLFIENLNNKTPHSIMYSTLHKIMPNIKHYFIGCNFGPYTEQSFKDQYDNIFKSAVDVCFRESYSASIFDNLDNVRFAPDVVFQYEIKAKKKIDKSIGISLIDLSNRSDLSMYESSYIDVHIRLITDAIENNNKITLFSFCRHEGDERVISKLLDLIDPQYRDKIEVVLYNGDLDLFLSKYSEMEKMICSRFHAMILSLILKQPIFPIIYSKKMINVLEDIHFDSFFCPIKEIKKMSFERINQQTNLTDVSIEISKSVEQFYSLDLFLNK